MDPRDETPPPNAETNTDADDGPPAGWTAEQWATFQEYTRGYGDQDENGIDLSLLRENLKLTPTERLQKLRGFLSGLFGFDRAAGRRAAPVPDYPGLFRRLTNTRSRFVLIGGGAMAAHGCAHVTSDVDLAVAAEDRDAFACALSPYRPRPTTNGDVPMDAANLALTTDFGDIDLRTYLDGVDGFGDLWRRASVLPLYGCAVRVASLNDLVAMKQSVNRLGDQLHVMELSALRRLTQNKT